MINSINIDKLGKFYFIAKQYVIHKGYSNEIDWQFEVDFKNLDKRTFLREYTWVVLASGLSDKVVRKVFPKVSIILNDWIDLEPIVKSIYKFEKKLLNIFNNKLKIKALLDTIEYVYKKSFKHIKKMIKEEGLNYLKKLSFIGEITCYHLAKNIGIPLPKPDRHLVRIAETLGFNSTEELCSTLSDNFSEKIQVVDIVIWRYATLDKNYQKRLKTLNFEMH